MKKREAWMRTALTKATRAGFVYAESEDELASSVDLDDVDSRKVTELIMNFKQLKAQLQVSIFACGSDY